MKKSPTIINFFEKTKKCCQTFLSSCCDYDSRKTTSKPSSILVHRYQPMPAEPEFTNPFVNILNQQRPEPKTILYPNGAIDNAELLKKFNLETGLAPYEAPVPLSSLQIEKQKKRYFKNHLQSRINSNSESNSSLNGTIARANGSSKKRFRRYC
jgi:hypothetical protein